MARFRIKQQEIDSKGDFVLTLRQSLHKRRADSFRNWLILSGLTNLGLIYYILTTIHR